MWIFDLFKKKKEEPKQTPEKTKLSCNCENINDQVLEVAELKTASTFLIEALKRKYPDITEDDYHIRWNHDTNAVLYFKHRDREYSFEFFPVIFNKRACLSCGTCMGWSRYLADQNIWSDEFMESEFSLLLENNISKQDIVHDRKQRAKEICGVNNV